MNRFEFLEKRYTHIHIGFLLIMLIHLELSKWIGISKDIGMNFFLLIAGLIAMIIKIYVLEKDILKKNHLYVLFKAIELLIAAGFVYYSDRVSVMGVVVYLLFLIEIISVHEALKSIRFKDILCYFIPLILMSAFILRKDFFSYENIVKTTFIIVVSIAIIYSIKWMLDGIEKVIKQDKDLLESVRNKNEELIKVKEHLEIANKELEKQKEEMKITSDNFRNSVAELFILRETSTYIGSILEIRQLLEVVCDMILGIMGVDTCSIIVYDEKDDTLDFHIKSIYNKEIIEKFKENVWSSSLQKRIKDKKILIDNHSKTKKYGFLEGREVGSFVAVPLYKGNKSYGLILAEHSLDNYFSTSSTDLFKAVSMQVAIAIENAKLYEQMEDMAVKDGLTKIYNRMYLQNIMPQLLDDAKNKKQSIAVSIFDIDHFKRFNDTYGHIFGDEVIKLVAKLGQNKVNIYGGIIARYGGEEFIMIFPNISLKKAATIIEELRREIEEFELKKGNKKAKITASFGVSGYPEIASSVGELIRTADDAMYLSKNNGRNCVTVATTGMNDE